MVGAGYSMSHETGDVATLVKLMRVAMLLPVIVFAVMLTRARGRREAAGGTAPAAAALVRGGLRACWSRINSTGWVPAAVPALGSDVSRWCLVAAIAGIGMKTQLRDSPPSASSRSR